MLPLLLAFAAMAAEPSYLGVVEPNQWVRVPFRFQDGRWEVMPRTLQHIEPLPGLGKDCQSLRPQGCRFPNMGTGYPKALSWTVAFDGRNIGTIRSSQPELYTDVEQLGGHVISPSTPPLRTGPDKRFELPDNFRLLAAVSKPNYADPDQWKQLALTGPGLPKRLRAAYHSFALADPKNWWHCDPGKQLVVDPRGYRNKRG